MSDWKMIGHIGLVLLKAGPTNWETRIHSPLLLKVNTVTHNFLPET
jgi:hypothetical protein